MFCGKIEPFINVFVQIIKFPAIFVEVFTLLMQRSGFPTVLVYRARSHDLIMLHYMARRCFCMVDTIRQTGAFDGFLPVTVDDRRHLCLYQLYCCWKDVDEMCVLISNAARIFYSFGIKNN